MLLYLQLAACAVFIQKTSSIVNLLFRIVWQKPIFENVDIKPQKVF